MTVSRLKSEITYGELSQWVAFYQYRADEQKRAEGRQKGNILAMDPEEMAQRFK